MRGVLTLPSAGSAPGTHPHTRQNRGTAAMDTAWSLGDTHSCAHSSMELHAQGSIASLELHQRSGGPSHAQNSITALEFHPIPGVTSHPGAPSLS